MLKTILNYHDRLDRVLTLTKTKYENYASDRIDVVYTEKWNWSVVIDQTKYGLSLKPNRTTMW